MGGGGDSYNCFLCSSSYATSSECLEGSSWTSIKLLVAHLLQLTPELRWEPPPSFDERRRVYHRILEGGNGEGTSEEEDVRRWIRICGDCQGIAERVSELHNEIQKMVKGLREVVVNSKRRWEDLEDDSQKVSKKSRKERRDMLDFSGVVAELLDAEKLTPTDVKVEVPCHDESFSDFNGSGDYDEVASTVQSDDKAVQGTNRRRKQTTNLGPPKRRKAHTIQILKKTGRGDGEELEEEKKPPRRYSLRRQVPGISEKVEYISGREKGGNDVSGYIPENKDGERKDDVVFWNDDEDKDWSEGGGDVSKCESEPDAAEPSHKLFFCEFCPERLKFDKRFKLTHHLIQVHNRTDLVFKCDVPNCLKVFLSNSELKRHKNLHTRRFVCGVCDRTFPSVSKLKRHSATHSPAKQKRLSKEPKPKCLLCSREYSSKFFLQEHMKATHGVGDAGFTCDICQKHFSYRTNRTRHLASHQKVNNFTCETCGFATNSKVNLKRHQYYKHNPEKKIGCPHCDKKFKSKQELVSHLVVHTKERAFQCDLCRKSYSTVRVLAKHKKNLHGRWNERIKK